MKKFRFFAVAACLAISSGAFAQFTNTSQRSSSANASTSQRSSSTNEDTEGWSTIWVEYNPIKMKVDVKGADDTSMTGFSAGYSGAFCLFDSTPIFLEAGIGVQYCFYSEDYDAYGDGSEMIETKFNMWSVKVPVNFLYNFAIPNSSICLAPFVGVTARGNVSGTIKSDGESINVFDKDDMGEAWKRFQIGWQVGLKARFGKSFMAGVSYGSDFSEIAEKTKLQTTSITIGYTF